MILTAIYGQQYALGWLGQRTTWHGQPAWLQRQRSHGLSTATLNLPWLNASVTAQSSDPSLPAKLIARTTPRTRKGLAVPSRGSTVFIQSLAGTDGDHQRRNASVTDPAAVRRLLSDLRHLPSVTSPRRACDSNWWPHTAVITVHDGRQVRTYAARFDHCGLVIAGTGSAGRATERLYNDVKRLVPNSNL